LAGAAASRNGAPLIRDRLTPRRDRGRRCPLRRRPHPFTTRGLTMHTPFRADVPDTPRVRKTVKNPEAKTGAYKAEIEKIRKRGRSLKWERVNDVTWKLVEEGRNVEIPRVHGKWPGFRTTEAIAWVINVGWVAGAEGWLGRCRDKRG